MTLRELEKRRLELLTKCARVDREASQRREVDLPLSDRIRSGFKYHVELRIIEREIAKLKERK